MLWRWRTPHSLHPLLKAEIVLCIRLLNILILRKHWKYNVHWLKVHPDLLQSKLHQFNLSANRTTSTSTGTLISTGAKYFTERTTWGPTTCGSSRKSDSARKLCYLDGHMIWIFSPREGKGGFATAGQRNQLFYFREELVRLRVVYNELVSAFDSKIESLGKITCEPK